MLNFDNNPQCSCFYSWPREEKKLFLASFDQPHSVMRVTFEIYQWIMIVIWCPFRLHYQLTDDRNDIAFKKRRHLNWANLSWSNIRSLECHFFLHFFLEPSSSLPSCPQCNVKAILWGFRFKSRPVQILNIDIGIFIDFHWANIYCGNNGWDSHFKIFQMIIVIVACLWQRYVRTMQPPD